MIALRPARPDDTPRLLAIWRAAVLATHDFLDPADFREIERMVAERYLPVAPFWLVVDERDVAAAFMGMTDHHIDSLFVDPDRRGKGIGRSLVEHARSLHPGLTVDVNEQDLGAVGFYERLGFRRIGRSPHDDAGRPYPLLHMALDPA
jgi:putative acetyltransferase